MQKSWIMGIKKIFPCANYRLISASIFSHLITININYYRQVYFSEFLGPLLGIPDFILKYFEDRTRSKNYFFTIHFKAFKHTKIEGNLFSEVKVIGSQLAGLPL